MGRRGTGQQKRAFVLDTPSCDRLARKASFMQIMLCALVKKYENCYDKNHEANMKFARKWVRSLEWTSSIWEVKILHAGTLGDPFMNHDGLAWSYIKVIISTFVEYPFSFLPEASTSWMRWTGRHSISNIPGTFSRMAKKELKQSCLEHAAGDVLPGTAHKMS